MTRTITSGLARQVDAVAQERQRLRVLFAVAVLKLFNFIGGAWDIQWHVAIGRDSLWIPPHLLVFVAFVGGLALVVLMIFYETALAASGQPLLHSARLGPFRAPHAYFGILFGYTGALLAALFDEFWHRTFGIDATLWSPPHLLIMVATMVVDYSLLLGITASSRRLGYSFAWNSPLVWGIVLAGAYAYEAVHFQMGEAFIIGYRHGGAGLYGLLFPILVGAFLPLSLLTCIRLAGRFWIVVPVFVLALLLQYLATGISALGFAILKPVSVIYQYVLLNPNSTAALARKFAALLGNNGLIGVHQAWTMTLAAPALVLVALLGLFPWARRRPLLAAPLFSIGMVLSSALWFEFKPVLQDYPLTGIQLVQACLLAGTGGLLTGSLGLRLARWSLGDRSRSLRLLVTLLPLLLVSCMPPTSGVPGTVSVGTVAPEPFTPLPPGFTPPPAPTVTPVPTLPGGLGLAELKYRLLAEFPDFFFCDPDFYPVARDDEMELARQRFPEIQADPDVFETILAHTGLEGVSAFTDEQKLLVYRDFKKLSALVLEPAGDSYRFQIQVAEVEGEGVLVTGLIDGQGLITTLERTASIATCPICLAAGTLIDTPAGPLRVESLRPGMSVWTLNEAGERIAQPLERVGKTNVPLDHQVIHLILEDRRQVWVSPGHPTTEGMNIGHLQVGDPLDGSAVLSTERVVYAGLATYDLLPAGETGSYWANGILLASTLKH
jgi:hypothetical protein